MEAKKRLARTVTAQYHGEAGAAQAEAHFARVVQKKEIPENIEEVRISSPSGEEPLWRILALAGLVASNSEGRRQVQHGAVELDGVRVSDLNLKIHPSPTPRLLQVGKRKFKRFVLEKE
jgi:tyrosyl-tRNA synthetase